ncbi:MAG TPA: 16S rRNA (cytosine(967)-C(5))-methyltransferase RsmB [Pyrinomonadaceae bacterium]|jgi:16S rRNA (cytosine967-C5)-methyltransferase
MKISPARVAAFEILAKIESEKAFSSALLPVYEEKLSVKDRALCHELALGVLRRKIYLDALIEKLTGKKIEKFDLAVAVALRIGLYQLLFLDKIPAHAAINESVNLVRKAKKTSAKPLVNAVLRRVLREKVELEFAEEIEKVSVRTSHPRWLLEKWIRQLGFEDAAKLAQANNEMPKLAFRLTGKFHDRDAENLNGFEKSEFLENCFFAAKIDANLLELAENGEIYFQDEASQMVATLVKIGKGENFLDVCAAPGSKTTLIAGRGMQNAKLIAAGDFYRQRVKILRENCRKQDTESVKIVRYDAEKSLPFAENAFDWVLVDAPCTGTGTIRHNPEIRYFLSEKDFAELAEKQLEILKNASKQVKTGGHLIYSTCSLEREENESVVEKFLAGNSEFKKCAPRVPERFLTADGFARTFPQRDGMDGFFIAAFEKRV